LIRAAACTVLLLRYDRAIFLCAASFCAKLSVAELLRGLKGVCPTDHKKLQDLPVA
jgi:hypothetical protein